MEMQVISSYPASSNFIHVDNFDELGRMVEQIADIICDSKEHTSITYFPTKSKLTKTNKFSFIFNTELSVRLASFTDVNECSSNPCVEGQGSCQDSINMFLCQCFSGFGGRHCEHCKDSITIFYYNQLFSITLHLPQTVHVYSYDLSLEFCLFSLQVAVRCRLYSRCIRKCWTR